MRQKIILPLIRPRTLPLALAVIIIGNAIAYHQESARFSIFILSLATALCLQILSNLANDYGDGLKGTDKHRTERLTAQGKLNPHLFFAFIIFFALFSFFLGVALIILSLETALQRGVFLALGILSILAALFYTIGKRPYGYLGLGELAVWVFFGLIGVIGSYGLQHLPPPWWIIFPANAFGFMAAAVLNLNNLRDIQEDRLSGKNTLASRMGLKKGKTFHHFLIALALFNLFIFVICAPSALPCLLITPFLIHLSRKVAKAKKENDCASLLKPMVINTFLCALLAALGLLFI